MVFSIKDCYTFQARPHQTYWGSPPACSIWVWSALYLFRCCYAPFFGLSHLCSFSFLGLLQGDFCAVNRGLVKTFQGYPVSARILSIWSCTSFIFGFVNSLIVQFRRFSGQLVTPSRCSAFWTGLSLCMVINPHCWKNIESSKKLNARRERRSAQLWVLLNRVLLKIGFSLNWLVNTSCIAIWNAPQPLKIPPVSYITGDYLEIPVRPGPLPIHHLSPNLPAFSSDDFASKPELWDQIRLTVFRHGNSHVAGYFLII